MNAPNELDEENERVRTVLAVVGKMLRGELTAMDRVFLLVTARVELQGKMQVITNLQSHEEIQSFVSYLDEQFALSGPVRTMDLPE